MTRETKVGLLVGMGVILLIGIIISDHLSVVQQQDPAEMTDFAQRAQHSITQVDPQVPAAVTPAPVTAVRNAAPAVPGAAVAGREPSVMQRMQMVPTPQEMRHDQWQPAPRDSGAQATPHDLPRAYRLDASGTSAAQPPAHTQSDAVAPSFAAPVPRITLSHLPGTTPAARAAGTMSLEDESVTQPRTVETVLEAPLPAGNASAGASGAGSEIIHYVQPGETLYQIAQKYYGNGDYWRTIAAHNPDRVKANGQVNQNVRLVVPNRAGLAALGDDFVPAGHQLTRRITPAVKPDPPATIKVESGDTLTGLASKHLGTSTRWRELFEANKDQLDRPESLRAGMTLVLPQEKSASVQGAVASPSPAPLRVLTPQVREKPAPVTAKRYKSYVVEPGDSLYRIASKTLGDGERWREVFEANRSALPDANTVTVGQELKIPQ